MTSYNEQMLIEIPSLPATVNRESKDAPSAEYVPIDSSFPEAEANKLAAIESFNKHLFRPNTYLHKWWARRAGSTFRYILKQLVKSSSSRAYYSPGGLEGVTILDPMCGGGTTLHEAIRLGANVLGFDVDPIPVLQARASLRSLPLQEKIQVFDKFFAGLKKVLSKHFVTECPNCELKVESQFYLYGVSKRCPCREVVILDSLILRSDPDGKSIRICAKCTKVHSGTHKCAKKVQKLFAKDRKNCPDCQQPFTELLDLPIMDRYVPLAVVGKCPDHDQFFSNIRDVDLQLLAKAKSRLSALNLPANSEVQISNGPKSRDLLRRKIYTYKELFTPRQLIYISKAQEFLSAIDPIHQEWLALLISTSLEFNSGLCGYKGAEKKRPGAIRHVFSHHAYSFPSTMLENNPVFEGNTSGTLKRLFRDRIFNAAQWAACPIERIEVKGVWEKTAIRDERDGGREVAKLDAMKNQSRAFFIKQANSTKLPIPSEFVDFVVTDPPYFDSVQYSDLSNFFRVWLRWFVPGRAEWGFDILNSAVAKDNLETLKYGNALAGIWKECHRVLKKGKGRLIFTFHHWNPNAWASLTLALRSANYSLVSKYVVHSENPSSVHINGLKALKHDAILVLKPIAKYSRSANIWDPPLKIDTRDSYRFTAACAESLGWMLSSSLTDEEIFSNWSALIQPNANASSSNGHDLKNA